MFSATLTNDELKILTDGLVDNDLMKDKLLIVQSMEYIVKQNGTIFSTVTDNEISQRINEDGYMCVTVGKKGSRRRMRVHQMIALAFIPKLDATFEVNHKDSDRVNNCATNLEWISHSDNVRHAYQCGFKDNHGSNNPRSKLTESIVIEIRSLYDNGINTIQEIATKYGRGWSTIFNVVNRKTWKLI